MTKVKIDFDRKLDKKLNKNPTIKSVGIIYKTTNYNLFVLNAINRNINPARVQHFVREYKKRNIISPIEVMRSKDGKLVILDGQHRYRAWVKMDAPVYFYETISGDDSTQGLRQRNQSKSWTSLDTVFSFASDNRNPEVQKQYRDLQEIIMLTQEKLGRVPLISLIELASGIDKALDQKIVYAKHDFKNGLYQTLNREGFEKVIERIAIMQTKLTKPVNLTATMFRGLFTLLSNEDANAAYLAHCINQDRLAFDAIAASNDNVLVAKELFSLYNTKATLNRQQPISIAMGLDGIILKDKHYNLYLKNEKGKKRS